MTYDCLVLSRDEGQVLFAGLPEPIDNVGFLVHPKRELVDSSNRFLVPWPFSSNLYDGETVLCPWLGLALSKIFTVCCSQDSLRLN